MARNEAGIPGMDRWHWTTQDGAQLAAKFKAAVLECLREFSAAAGGAGGDPPQQVSEQVEDFEAAAQSLDECAANCHVAAKALRVAWELPASTAAEANVGDRLERSVGCPVVLVRTTIDELRDAALVLAQVDGHNAIVQHVEDYWGTPADRLVVLPTEDEQASLSESGKASESAAAPSARVVEFLERLEAGLQPPILIYSGNNPGVVRLDVCGERGGEVVSLKSLPPDLKRRLGEARKHTSDLVLAGQAPQLENDFYFRLGKGELSNVLQFLTMMNRSGVLDVGPADGSGGDRGGCVFVLGTRVSHAEYGNYDGTRALAEMLTLEGTVATFRDGVEPPVRTITSSTDQLLIEAAIQADELMSERRRGE